MATEENEMGEVREGPYTSGSYDEQAGSNDEAVASKLRSSLERVQGGLRDVDQQIRDFVSERPLTAVAAAVGIGFLLGKLISRRRGE